VKKFVLVLSLLFVVLACRHEPPVREAKMRIVVADTAAAVQAVTEAAEARGGYLEAAELWREGEQLRARLTLRVPPTTLTPTLAAIRSVADRVDSETVKAR
jgi:hypothetical protein